MKDLIKVIEQESYEYSDPITQFLECLFVRYDFEGAQQKLSECEEVLEHDYFLSALKDEFVENARCAAALPPVLLRLTLYRFRILCCLFMGYCPATFSSGRWGAAKRQLWFHAMLVWYVCVGVYVCTCMRTCVHSRVRMRRRGGGHV